MRRLVHALAAADHEPVCARSIYVTNTTVESDEFRQGRDRLSALHFFQSLEDGSPFKPNEFFSEKI